MNLRKTYLTTAASVSLFIYNFLFLVSGVSAADISPDRPAQQGASELCSGNSCPVNSVSDIFNILKKIVQYTYIAFFFIAVLFILLAAYNFLFARGDATKIKDARNEILYAAIAIAIALISVGAAQIIQSFIGGVDRGPLPQ